MWLLAVESGERMTTVHYSHMHAGQVTMYIPPGCQVDQDGMDARGKIHSW